MIDAYKGNYSYQKSQQTRIDRNVIFLENTQ